MRRMALRVDVSQVAEAMDRSEEEPFDRVLDLETGAIELLPHERGFGDDLAPELERALAEQPDRFPSIPRIETREQFLWMSDFAASLDASEDDVRARLSNALSGRGAFGRFRAVLAEYRDLESRWFSERAEHFAAAAESWLRSLDVEVEAVRPKTPERGRPAAPVANKKQLPPVTFAQVLLLGAAEPASSPDRVRRVLVAKGQGRAFFKLVVRDFCETHGMGWRKRYIEGKSSFEQDGTLIRHDEGRVEVEVPVPADIARLFQKS